MGGGIGTPRLAYAVAAAGALGMVGASDFDRATLVEAFVNGKGRAAPGQHVGAGFLIPFVDRGAVAAVAPLVKVIEFFYGDPDPALVQLGHCGGALVSWQAGSAEEARAAAGAGCDFVIAQGIEAGGHVRGKIGVLMLLDEVLGAVDVPVLAAGAWQPRGAWRPHWRPGPTVSASEHDSCWRRNRQPIPTTARQSSRHTPATPC